MVTQWPRLSAVTAVRTVTLRDGVAALSLGARCDTTSGRLPHGIIYHPKSGIYHLRYIPWDIQNRKMVYIMVYTIDIPMVYTITIIVYTIYIYHGIYPGMYHGKNDCIDLAL
jgi:hypothetical protein